jgi:hypothetical protein
MAITMIKVKSHIVKASLPKGKVSPRQYYSEIVKEYEKVKVPKKRLKKVTAIWFFNKKKKEEDAKLEREAQREKYATKKTLVELGVDYDPLVPDELPNLLDDARKMFGAGRVSELYKKYAKEFDEWN